MIGNIGGLLQGGGCIQFRPYTLKAYGYKCLWLNRQRRRAGGLDGRKGWRAGGLEWLEGWKVGRLEGWRAGRLEGWRAGGLEWLEGWRAGGLEGWKEGWRAGRAAIGGLEGLEAGMVPDV